MINVIGGGGGEMVDTEDVEEERELRLFCKAKPGRRWPKQTMQTKPRTSFLNLDRPVQNLWKLRRQVVQMMRVWSQQIVWKHHWPELLSMSRVLRSDQRSRAGNAAPISEKGRRASHCASLSEVVLDSWTSFGGRSFAGHHEKVSWSLDLSQTAPTQQPHFLSNHRPPYPKSHPIPNPTNQARTQQIAPPYNP